jgi:hypothetical protein
MGFREIASRIRFRSQIKAESSPMKKPAIAHPIMREPALDTVNPKAILL